MGVNMAQNVVSVDSAEYNDNAKKKYKPSLLKTIVNLIQWNDLDALIEKLPILERRIQELENNEEITNTGKRNLRQFKKYKKLIESGNIDNILKGKEEEEEVNTNQEKSKPDDYKPKNNTQKKKKKRFVLFVGNLAYETSENAIREHFKNVGDIVSIRLGRDQNNAPKGFCHLELADQSSYENALSKHHSFLDRRRINVVYSGSTSSKTGDNNIAKAKIRAKELKLRYLQKNGLLQCQWNGKPMKRKPKAKKV